jgi:hypothetical protein
MVPTASDEISDTEYRFSNLLRIFATIAPSSIHMARNILQSIETVDSLSPANGSVLSDSTYEEERTPEAKACLSWGGKEELAGREAIRANEERERNEDEELEAIRILGKTEPAEFRRQMREYNLRLQGLTKEEIDKSNQPLPKEVVKENWDVFGKVLQSTTADMHADAPLRSRKQTKEGSHTIRRSRIVKNISRSQPKRSTSTLTKALQPKHHTINQRKGPAARTSRRIAGDPVERGIFADPSVAQEIPKNLLRDPSTRKQNSTDRRNHAPCKKLKLIEAEKPQVISKSGGEGPRHSRNKKQSGC